MPAPRFIPTAASWVRVSVLSSLFFSSQHTGAQGQMLWTSNAQIYDRKCGLCWCLRFLRHTVLPTSIGHLKVLMLNRIRFLRKKKKYSIYCIPDNLKKQNCGPNVTWGRRQPVVFFSSEGMLSCEMFTFFRKLQ